MNRGEAQPAGYVSLYFQAGPLRSATTDEVGNDAQLLQFEELRGPQPRPAEARKSRIRSFAFSAGCGPNRTTVPETETRKKRFTPADNLGRREP